MRNHYRNKDKGEHKVERGAEMKSIAKQKQNSRLQEVYFGLLKHDAEA